MIDDTHNIDKKKAGTETHQQMQEGGFPSDLEPFTEQMEVVIYVTHQKEKTIKVPAVDLGDHTSADEEFDYM